MASSRWNNLQSLISLLLPAYLHRAASLGGALPGGFAELDGAQPRLGRGFAVGAAAVHCDEGVIRAAAVGGAGGCRSRLGLPARAEWEARLLSRLRHPPVVEAGAAAGDRPSLEDHPADPGGLP